MRVALIDVDSTKPNLALMKLSAWHKAKGDTVEWYDPLFGGFDKVYASKVFTFTPDYGYYPAGTIKGGTGYTRQLNEHTLHDDIEHTCPDYGLYHCAYSMGFLTRGCSRKCPECFVPDKEGAIRAHADIDEFIRHDSAVLMDNNVLAHHHGIEQIEKLTKFRIKVDFNQGLDARLIDSHAAKLLAGLRWLKPLRLACDSPAMKRPVARAVECLRAANVTPSRYSCYLLVKDVKEAHDRSEFLRALGVDPFAQSYRDKDGTPPTKEQSDFARWVNHKATWKSVPWRDYRR